MNQYKVSLHDCNKDPNFNRYKFKLVIWDGEDCINAGIIVRKRITTRIVSEILNTRSSYMLPEDLKECLKATIIKEYDTK